MFLRESEADRVAKREIATVVAVHFGFGLEKVDDITYGFDFCLINGYEADGSPRVIMYLEAKNRDGTNGNQGWVFEDGDGYRLSLAKAEKAKVATATTGLDCLLAVRFIGGRVFMADFRRRDKRVIMAGRKPRPGCPNDWEPHVIFPWRVWDQVP